MQIVRFSPVLLLLVATAVGYYAVYVLTPKDLVWHLDTSVTRLWLQLWPSLLFLLFFAAASPPERPDDRGGSG